jgi:hypothetical protein
MGPESAGIHRNGTGIYRNGTGMELESAGMTVFFRNRYFGTL